MANNQIPAELMQGLQEKFSQIEVLEDQTVIVPGEDLFSLLKELKENEEYALDYLTNVTAVDYEDRFEVVYHLLSITKDFDLTVKVKIADKVHPEVPSLCALWKGAEWQEREVYDLMGINFTGYPDHPTRILLLDTFEGHPLRKDFQFASGRE